MTDNQSHSRRDLPAWVFLLIILLCIGGGIGFVVWYFSTPNPIREQVLLKSEEQIAAERAEQAQRRQAGADRGERPRRRGGAAPAATSRIRQVAREGNVRTFEVTSGQITMHVRDVPRAENEFTFRMRRGLNLLSPEIRNLTRVRWGILGDDNIADYLRVTEQQRNQLREMTLSNDLVVSDESLAMMRTLWSNANPRRGGVQPQAEAQILALLDQIATESEAPTRQLWTKQLQPIESILTPQQIAAYQQMGRPDAQRPPPPATQPAR